MFQFLENYIPGFMPPGVIEGFRLAFKLIYLTLPVWLPAAFLIGLFNAWIRYHRSKNWQKEGHMMLELKLPKEVSKSPAAMEIVIGALNQGGGESTWINRIWEGKTRPWFSLEIVSIGGKVKFFIWTWPRFRKLIETQIYAQFPGVEIYEAEDYTKPFYYNPEVNNIWGCEFALTKPDPYPIKTYVDYGLEGNPKEENKIDPMTPLIEFLGSINEGENIWFQILIRAHKKRRVWEVFSEKEDAWKDAAKKEIEEITAKFRESAEKKGRPPSKGESEAIAAIERSISKMSFDCGIRAVYVADKDKYTPTNIAGISGGLKQCCSEHLNGFKPAGWFTIFDYPWQEWGNPKEKFKPQILEEYKMRRFFYSPLRNKTVWGKNIYSKPFVLNTEELATLFHFPGLVAATPNLERLPSKKAEAPFNLPT